MNREEVRKAVVEALGSVAPEADTSALSPGADLRDELDIDSMDFLRFLVLLKEKVGVEVPERDYGRVRTLGACVEYVAARLGV